MTSAGWVFPVGDETDAKHFALVPARGSTAAFDGLEDADG